MTPRRAHVGRVGRVVAMLVMAGGPVVTGVVATGCSSDESRDVLTRADMAERAGLSFPDSTAGFRLTRVSAGEVHVTFELAAADVDGFADQSDLRLIDGSRVITHASPLWDLNPTGTLVGATSTVSGVTREVEVVTEAGKDPVARVVLSGI